MKVGEYVRDELPERREDTGDAQAGTGEEQREEVMWRGVLLRVAVGVGDCLMTSVWE